MNTFIKKISLFLIPIVIISYPLDYLISFLLKQSNKPPAEFEVINDIYNGNANCDIAIYGNSRALHHFNTKLMQDSLNASVYNFGIDGHNFWLQYMRHLEFLHYNSKPKTILLNVDVLTLQKREYLYNYTQFLPYMLWNKTIEKYTSSYVGFKRIDYCIPLIRYYGKKDVFRRCVSVALKKDGVKKHRYKGYNGVDKQWNTDFIEAKEKMDSYVVKIDTPTVSLFEKFILECKHKDINLILVYTPEYIEGQKFVENRDSVVNIYSDFAIKYNLLFLNYSNNSICKNKEFFYNSTHLNKKGSILFTKLLIKDIESEAQHYWN